MTLGVLATLLAAVLATYAVAGEDIQARNLTTGIQVRFERAANPRFECQVLSWDEFGFDGSCGRVEWDELKPGEALAVLKAIVGDKDPEASVDAAVVAVSLVARPEPKGGGKSPPKSPAASPSTPPAQDPAPSTSKPIGMQPAVDWARRSGATPGQIEAIPARAEVLRAARADRRAARRLEELVRQSPEAAAFTDRNWTDLHSGDVESVSAATTEAARGILASAGGSASLHQTEHIALLAEGDSSANAKIAARLEVFFNHWKVQFSDASVRIAEQGAIPVVIVSDRDRWRMLVQVAFGGDASRHPDAVTIYPKTGEPAEHRPIVLVCPAKDASLLEYNACVGLARAMMHLADSQVRCPAWLNEALPKIMADSSQGAAGMDADFRKYALPAVRSGADFRVLLEARYGDPAWTRDPALAQSMAFMFARWIADNAPIRLIRYAEGPRTGESEADRFRRYFGMSMDEAAARATKWFQTND